VETAKVGKVENLVSDRFRPFPSEFHRPGPILRSARAAALAQLSGVEVGADPDLRNRCVLAEIRTMFPELQSEISDLRDRVKRLEESAGRTRRGRG
jgi:hypothetical protein